MFNAVVVLPTPPFWFATEITRDITPPPDFYHFTSKTVYLFSVNYEFLHYNHYYRDVSTPNRHKTLYQQNGNPA
jgi:hypothetical protein